jgi:UDP-N-acetylglucosamine 2-epimerase
MRKIKILTIVGARPNFIKIAPLFEEFKRHKSIKRVLVHTGQHYDFEMSPVFFKELKIPKPDYNLGVGSGSHAWQTAKMMEKLEPLLLKEKPDLVIVIGDVNSTLAGALTAVKVHVPVAHIEAGVRSFDMSRGEKGSL